MPNKPKINPAWLARLHGFMQHRDRRFLLATIFGLLAVLGLADYWTGFELSLSLFYLLPVVIATGYIGRRTGYLTAGLGVVVWLVANWLAGEVVSHGAIRLWNALIRLAFFALQVWLLDTLKTLLDHERVLARTDFLTGVANTREFHRLAAVELLRSRRHQHPFTLAYLDLDNFKHVNDRRGHAAGDELLRLVAQTIQTQMRRTDVVARVGGDEFALLLPETDGLAAQSALTKLRAALLEQGRRHAWEVTVSIGASTFDPPPESVEETLRVVDRLMYDVKSRGKDGLFFSHFPSGDLTG